MGRQRVTRTGPGALGPPELERGKGRAVSKAMIAANDNGPGRRKVVLRNFQTLPVGLDEVAVIDRLMQELPMANNDNTDLF